MKRVIFFAAMLTMMLAFYAPQTYAQMGPGMMGPGYGNQNPEGYNYCPNCGGYLGQGGGYGMGPGMMGRGYGMGPGMMGRGYGMGPGMMGRGYGMGPGMMGRGYGGGQPYGPQYGPGYQGPQYQEQQKPLDEKDAKAILEDYLQSTRNPNLKIGKIEDKGQSFEAEIQTKDGSLVDKIAIDKRTGWMRSIY